MEHLTVTLALDEMLRYGSDLTQMHTLTFIFTFPREEQAEEAAALLLRREGVQPTIYVVRPPWWKALFTRPRWAIYGTRLLVPERDEIFRLASVFNAIAQQCGGTYDRWEAKLVR